MPSRDELRECPFCGDKVNVYYIESNHADDISEHIHCFVCGASFEIAYTHTDKPHKELLISHWNTRPSATQDKSDGWIDVKDSPDCTERFIVTVEDADEELWVADSLYRYVESERYGYWEIEVKGKVKVKAYMDLPQPYTPAPEANDE